MKKQAYGVFSNDGKTWRLGHLVEFQDEKGKPVVEEDGTFPKGNRVHTHVIEKYFKYFKELKGD